MSAEERFVFRQEHSKPWVAKIRAWLDESLPLIPPKSLTGKVLSYLDKQWPHLVRFLEDGRLRLDTNLVENAIRPFAVGRKAWLFSDTVQGAEGSANLYSLVETAKANGGYARILLWTGLSRPSVAAIMRPRAGTFWGTAAFASSF